MIHMMLFAERKPDISKLQYHRHWLDIHLPKAQKLAQKYTGLRRYVQDHFLEPPPGLLYDGIVDLWLDSEKAVIETFTSREYLEDVLPDEANFGRPGGSQMIFTEDHVLLEGPPISKHDILGKVIFPLKRKRGMEAKEFHRYWREVHGPLVLKLPHLRRYVQSHTIVAKAVEEALHLPGGEPFYDGVEQLWFDNKSALREALGSLEAFVHVQPDLTNFVDLDRFVPLVTEEYRAVWPEG